MKRLLFIFAVLSALLAMSLLSACSYSDSKSAPAATDSNTYTVSFYDGASLVSESEVPEGHTFGGALPGVSGGSDQFIGWGRVPGGSAVSFDGNTPVGGNLTLYAVRVPANSVLNTVTFIDNGAAVVNSSIVSGVSYGENIPVLSNNAQYEFAGWSETEGSDIADFSFGQAISENLTVYAVWLPAGNKPRTVKFYSEDGLTLITSITVAHNSTLDDNIPVLTDDPLGQNRVFNGWSTLIGSNNISVYPTTSILSDISLYAVWAGKGANEFYVVFYNKDGTEYERRIYRPGQPLGEMPSNPDLDNRTHVFNGWSFFSTAAWVVPSTVGLVFEDTEVTRNLSLKQSWSYKRINVVYKDGEEIYYTAELSAGNPVNYLPANPRSKIDYRFSKWEFENGNEFTSSSVIYDNTTIYARWDPQIIYPVASASDLDNATVNNDLHGVYKLTADITLPSNFKPITGGFDGVLLGEDHTITIEGFDTSANTSNDLYTYLGIFSTLAGTVQDVKIHLDNVVLNMPAKRYYVYVGSIAGEFQGVIKNVKVTGALTINADTAISFFPYFGTVIGRMNYNDSYEITKVSSNADLTVEVSVTAGTSSNTSYIGGIGGSVGKISESSYSGAIKHKAATLDSPVATYIGGIGGHVNTGSITGSSEARVKNCYSTGTIYSHLANGSAASSRSVYYYVGGLFGTIQSGYLIKNSYSAMDISGLLETAQTSPTIYVGGLTGYTTTNSASYAYGVDNSTALNNLISLTHTPAFTGGTIRYGRVGSSSSTYSRFTNLYANSDMLLNGSVATENITSSEFNGESKALSEMTGSASQAFYESLGWDFTSIWKTTATGGPIFKWETE
jgi:hypothetical protein